MSSGDPFGDALWEIVLADFDAEPPHAKFIAHCRVSGRLDQAAKRYRTYCDDAELDDESKEKIDQRLAAIANLAMGQIEADQKAVKTKPYVSYRRVATAVVVGFFLMSLAALAYALWGL